MLREFRHLLLAALMCLAPIAVRASPQETAHAAAATTPPPRVHVELHGPARAQDEPLAVLVEFRAEEAPDSDRGTRGVELVDGSAEVLLPLDPSSGWKVRALAKGYWSPVVSVLPGSTSSLDVGLWQAAQAEADVVVPEGAQEVDELRLRFLEVLGSGEVDPEREHIDLQAVCGVVERKVTACSVPAGTWDVRVAAADFAPIHLWSLRLEPGKVVNLGELSLRRGGSVSGRVVTEEGPADPRRVDVNLRPLVERGTLSDAEKERLERLTRSTELSAWGYFQFVGVPSGVYELEAEQAGLSSARVSPVKVEAGELVEVEDPMTLRRPHRISVSISPALDPFGEGWTVRLLREATAQQSDHVATGRTDASGFWESPPVTKGRYVIRVLNEDGSSLAWVEREIPPEPEQVDIELPLIYVEGTVVLGDEPLEAELWFGGRSGVESVETRADEDGSFLVILPHEGEWKVDVYADMPKVQARGLEVEVEPVADLRTADVVIELPDTLVTGEVVDEAGLPPRGPVRVAFTSLGEWKGILDTTTDALGRFELRGMRPGPYYLEAEAAGKQSAPEPVRVAEDAVRFVRLTLQEELSMAGRVVSSSGPVAGALVLLYPFTGSGRLGTTSVVTAHSGVDGSFRMKVPGSSQQALVMVLAPGYSFHLVRVSKGGTGRYVLARGGGTLRLPPPADPGGSGEKVDLVMVNGLPVATQQLAQWAGMNGVGSQTTGRLSVPAMPSGDYARCRLTVEEVLAVLSGVALPASEACTQGLLIPGGELTLGAP